MPNNVIVPEIGIKCIYPVLDAEKIKNYCIQKDGTIIEIVNQKVVQTEENTHFLEHSTDTTAMKSFDNAAIIGIGIALFATWFAWWCAKKSFDLTKLSFDSLIQQIKDSTQSTIDTNIALIQSQEILKDKEISAERVLYLITNIREYFAIFIADLGYIANESQSLFHHINREYVANVNYDPEADPLAQEKIRELTTKRVECELIKSKILLLLNHEKSSHIKLLEITESCYQEMLGCFIGAIDQTSSSSTYNDFKKNIQNLIKETSLVVNNEIGE
ncbi:hypothetical protein F3J02_03955 [Acinetobacter sp. Tr-809]|uniref:hypothetical protein n=1 Tax=Acinetobacter sp. Tr-809 TaxID=2608324 RepID=UPI00141EFCE8|nr:hypothetical protein [Acinetobacter sp. Tr-809]NIE95643.1 hypothetical protein [Acinetobacter sp. Tr-809]